VFAETLYAEWLISDFLNLGGVFLSQDVLVCHGSQDLSHWIYAEFIDQKTPKHANEINSNNHT